MSPADLVTKLMQRYWRMTRALTLGAQGIVIDEAGRVLLIRHTYRPGWHFPGGGVEKGEPILTALTRELHEEAGIVLTAPPDLFGLYLNERYFPGDHIGLFLVRHWQQPVVPPPNREIAEQGFFATDALPEGTIRPVHDRLAELSSGSARALHW